MGELFFGALVGAALSILGGAGVYREVIRRQRVHKWPHTNGTILDSRLMEQQEYDNKSYRVRLLYRYAVDRLYKAKEDFSRIGTVTSGGAHRLWLMYPAGRTDLPIAYNPDRAEQHYIADNAHSAFRPGWLLMCAIFLFFGLSLLFMIAMLLAYR